MAFPGFLSGLAAPFTGVTDSLDSAVLDMDRKRAEAIRRAWGYYEGDGIPAMLRVRHDQPNDNVRLNPVAMIVDGYSAFLFGEDLDLSLDVDAEDERARYLDEVWEHNSKMTLLGDLRTNGGLSGHAFVKLHVRAGQMVRLEPPRLSVLDSANVHVVTDEDNGGRAAQYVVSWTVHRPGGAIARRQRIIREDLGWSIVDEESRGMSTRWEVTGVEQWPFTWAPIFDCKNLPAANQYLGRPDVPGQLLDLIDAVNAVAGNSRRVSRLHGHPKVWMSGVADTADVSSGPDEALIVPDEATVGVIAPPSGVEGHLALWQRLETAIHKEGVYPEVAAGRLDGIGDLSGLALRILYGPMVRRLGQMRGTYGALIRRIDAALLDLAGYEYAPTAVQWPEAVPDDPAAEAQTAIALQEAGVSQRTSLEQMGYDPDVEEERRQMEREQSSVGNLGAALMQFDAGNDGQQG